MTRPTASVSLDMDNLWSYMKIHGDPEWESRPSYLDALVPRMLEVFDGQGLTATVFVVGADAAREDGAKAVAEIAAAGHEVANHSYEHEPWLHRYDRGRLEAELARTEDAIVAAGAPRPTGFRGPGYSLSPELVQLLAERGYAYDASTLPTWIGPLARAYYFRSASLSPQERSRRSYLFGSASEGLRPVHPYRWRTGGNGDGLLEIPVTTVPVLRVPMHVSYLLHLHQVSPKLARGFFAAALRACRLRGVGPSMLLHPLDLLDARDAPRLGFFPGMALPAAEKVAVVGHVLGEMGRHFDVVGTGVHAARLAAGTVRGSRDVTTAGPRA
ncbi:MAG: polysaccharide deacetylase family protein [Pseudonocardia sp.]